MGGLGEATQSYSEPSQHGPAQWGLGTVIGYGILPSTLGLPHQPPLAVTQGVDRELIKDPGRPGQNPEVEGRSLEGQPTLQLHAARSPSQRTD